jgi:hypothetical protein
MLVTFMLACVMQNLSVQILRFVGNHQPGWVACDLLDAEGRRHVFIDKVPIFTIEPLDAGSGYPKPGMVRCEVLKRWQDEKGLELVRVSTTSRDGVESTEGLREFTVFARLITSGSS